MADTDAKAIIEAARIYGDVQTFTVERGDTEQIPVAAVPQGRTLHNLKSFFDAYLPAPERRKGTATVTTVASFIDLVNRFKDQESVVFADNGDNPSLLAVLDYNPAEPSPEEAAGGGAKAGAARFGEHRVAYRFPLSKEWVAWMEASKRAMSMADFAQFLEDRILDVRNPDEAKGNETIQAFVSQLGVALATPQKLMELSRGLTVNVNLKATQGINLTSGEGRLSFESKHTDEAGKEMSVPGAFVIAIPVFKLGPLWSIPVRLRHAVSQDGKVSWSIALQRTDWLLEAVIKEACEQVEAATLLPLFYGSPERP